MTMTNESILDEIERVLDEMHRQQTSKAQSVAQLINPGLTVEDILNPDNFPAVMSDPSFAYEDGLAAGILSAKMAIRSRLLELESSST